MLRRRARRRALFRRLGLRLKRSLLAVPAAYLASAVALGFAAPAIDRGIGSSVDLDVGVGAARDILTATATGMIAFTGLVVAGILVVVQFSAGQYSPRLVLWFRRDLLVKQAIGSFLAVPLYALVALRELELERDAFAPDVTVALALVALVSASLLFLAMLQRVTDRLRPRALYRAVAREGVHAVREVYPATAGDGRAPSEPERPWRTATPRVLALRSAPGVITSVDGEVLLQAATASGVTVELLRAVGEFVPRGEALLAIHGDAAIDEATLLAAVALADERTIEQDPAFAIRIIVDTAIRALSPAVNDPTTAVHALDALEVIVREMAARDLERRTASDPGGAVRLVWRSSGWADTLDLAFDEIRAYGAPSVQVCRRLRALLEDLHAGTPAVRHAAVDEHLARLDASIAETFPPGSPELTLARVADRMGLGLAR